MQPLALAGSGSVTSVKISPVVLFTICDSYIRRNDGTERVIGTLLGNITDGVANITNCYTVPHNESMDQVAVDIVHHKTLFDLHQKVSKKDLVIGWFSTGYSMNGSDALIQDFYGRECSSPIHLTVDTTLTDSQMRISTYVSRSLSLGDKQLATEFIEIPCQTRLIEAERIGVDLLDKRDQKELPDDMDRLRDSFQKLSGMVEGCTQYVEDVLAGRKPANAEIGRYLSDTVAAIPYISPVDFEKMYEDNMQDMLLVMYLSSLMRTQLAIADKLGTQLLPIL
eukprot:CAMPEP_0117667482 /NCGR_PEP_ID=MMETSP0804-20121206/10996_1 /TAXON_ID=1074897 /ORGANISM="Tetraselmis astigmatica, Strain CCMP880" /LENGTH=280 /DNA_ID=CAMNT_0005475223 /DNA_START=101 /DNA_END=943 /DNA_ORIENTATION=+